MKKNITLFRLNSLLLASLVIASASAQNSSPYWSLAGNSNANSISKLGTTTADPLNITTNNLTRLRIAADGKVGIGTTSPQQLFHVEGPTLLSIFVSTTAPGSISGSGMIGYVKGLPTAAGQRLGYFLTGSRGGAENNYNVAGMAGYAEGAWSSSSRPAYLTFETTNLGATSRTEKLRITATGYVGIGTTTPGAQLHVNTTGSYGIYTTGASDYGVWAKSPYLGVYGDAGSSGAYGVYGYAGSYALYGYGGSYGVYGYSYNSGGVGSYGYNYDHYGVQGDSYNGYGGYFTSTNNYGLVARTGISSGYYAGVFYGYVYSSQGFITSDKNLKTNVRDFSDAMSIINKLKPQNYEFRKDTKYASLNLPQGRHYGLMAQDLEQVLPNLVSEAPHELITSKPVAPIAPGADGKPRAIPTTQKEVKETINIKAVNYTELIPIMVKAMQEQNAENNQLKNQVEELKNELAVLKEQVGKLVNSQTVRTPAGIGWMQQNTPNPVRNNTTISYGLPEGSNRAQLQLTDNLGRTIKVVQLTGSGVTNIDVSSLSAGVYNYSLVVDNKMVETRKLTVVK